MRSLGLLIQETNGPPTGRKMKSLFVLWLSKRSFSSALSPALTPAETTRRDLWITAGVTAASSLVFLVPNDAPEVPEPTDVVYPKAFDGAWRLTRDTTDIQTPLGEKVKRAKALADSSFLALGTSVNYDVFFNGVQDRAKTWTNWAKAAPVEDPFHSLRAAFTGKNLIVNASQNLEQRFVRFVYSDSGITFDASEFAFVTLSAPRQNDTVLAQKIMTRWRWNHDDDRPKTIDGTEIVYYYLPEAFDDLMFCPLPNNPLPILAVNSHLRLERKGE